MYYDSEGDVACAIISLLIVMSHKDSSLMTKNDASWVIPNTSRNYYDSYVSMPFHDLLANQKMHVPYSAYSKILSGSCALR